MQQQQYPYHAPISPKHPGAQSSHTSPSKPPKSKKARKSGDSFSTAASRDIQPMPPGYASKLGSPPIDYSNDKARKQNNGHGSDDDDKPEEEEEEEEEEEDEEINVDPMRQDFQFYAMAHRVATVAKAKPKLLKILRGRNAKATERDITPMILNTYVNEQLMEAWEDEARAVRDAYRRKEEDDRIRFTQEDEIANRHCATLTARGEKKKLNAINGARAPATFSNAKLEDDDGDSESAEGNAPFN
jgi:hypothetical protein